jgi:hypothetical protein
MIAAWEAKLAGDSTDAEQRFAAARELAEARGFRYMRADQVAKLPLDELSDRFESANCIALACITAWRIFWMTMLRRAEPTGAPTSVFTETELALLDSARVTATPGQTRDLDFYITAVAKLGGYLARKQDAPPGTTVLWRGFSRLADIIIGFEAAQASQRGQTCG